MKDLASFLKATTVSTGLVNDTFVSPTSVNMSAYDDFIENSSVAAVAQGETLDFEDYPIDLEPTESPDFIDYTNYAPILAEKTVPSVPAEPGFGINFCKVDNATDLYIIIIMMFIMMYLIARAISFVIHYATRFYGRAPANSREIQASPSQA